MPRKVADVAHLCARKRLTNKLTLEQNRNRGQRVPTCDSAATAACFLEWVLTLAPLVSAVKRGIFNA